MKWLYVFSRFELSIPDRNRHAPDRLIPFPISRNTDFVFPSDFSVPVSVPDQKIQLRERLRGFPDRSRPFSSLSRSWGRSRTGLRCLVQEMIRQVSKVADRSELKITTSVANNGPVRSTDVDPHMFDLYKKYKYVGIDGPRDSLVKKLTGGDDVSKKKLKIISIFGEGGLGKTTLAKKVFDKLAANFLLKAFVPVGRNPDIKRVLEDILFEIDKEGNKNIHNSKKNEIQLIDLLRKLLENKRYAPTTC